MNAHGPAAGLGGLLDRRLPVFSTAEHPLDDGSGRVSGVSAGGDSLLHTWFRAAAGALRKTATRRDCDSFDAGRSGAVLRGLARAGVLPLGGSRMDRGAGSGRVLL